MTTTPPRVGLVANPQSGADVRRLTSLARTVDVHERSNIVARAVRGLAVAGVVEVVAMDDPSHVAARAWDAVSRAGDSFGTTPELRLLPGIAANADHTTSAARALEVEQVVNVITVGGDGTHRVVARGWPDVVFASLPAGTNNAFAGPVDPTVLGLAAGLHAGDPDRWADYVEVVPRLEVQVHDRDGPVGGHQTALVDVVAVRGSWVGARAVWDPALLVEAVVTRPDASVSGIAGVAAMAEGASVASASVHIRFGPGDRVALAPLGPGQLAMIAVSSVEEVEPDAPLTIGGPGMTLAFDGEREVVLREGEWATVRLVSVGPSRIAAVALVRAAAASGAFTQEDPAGLVPDR